MKHFQKLFVYSLSSLAIIASSITYADQEVTAPSLEGGITASIGTFLVTPSSDFEFYDETSTTVDGVRHTTASNVDPDYSFGTQASLGYVFEDTANGIELLYKNINTSDSNTDDIPCSGCVDSITGNLGYELNSGDLLISQFLNIGENMQMRLTGGLAYAELEFDRKISELEENTSTQSGIENILEESSTFTGWGPRLGADVRYDFGEDLAGFGIVGGGSLAYYLGELEMRTKHSQVEIESGESQITSQGAFDNSLDSHSVLNLRANLGIDYVYFLDNDEGSTVGLELGYLVDFYDDALGKWEPFTNEPNPETSSLTFSGPYLNLKGVF